MSSTPPSDGSGTEHTPAWPSPRPARPAGPTPPPPAPPTTPIAPQPFPPAPAPSPAPPPPPGYAPAPAYGAPPGYGPPPSYGPPPGYGPPAGPGPPPPKRSRKGLIALALVTVGVLALAATGFFVLRAVRGESGGADSAEAAVQDLAAALDAEDPVAALAVMNPDEVDALGDVYESAAAQAAELGFAPRSRTFAGVDIATSGLSYRTDELGPGVARVSVTGGQADLTLTRDRLTARTEEVLEQRARVDDDELARREEGRIERDDLIVETDEEGDVEPFVVAVERDGGWYVSPLYTASQYAVEVLGLADPSFPPPDAGEGANSPEDAVRDLLLAAGRSDGRATGDLATGEVGAGVRSYSGALEEWVGELGTDTSADIDTLETDEAERRGGGRRVVISELEGSLTWTEDDEETTAQIRWDGECLSIDEQTDDDGEMDDDDVDDDFCLTENWRRYGIEDLAVVAVESDDGWRIDPLATMTDYAADIVPQITETAVLRLVGYPELAEPTGEVASGESTEVELNDAGYAVVTVDAQSGEAFTVTTEQRGDGDEEVEAFLVSPDGEIESAYSEVTPEGSGQYRLVVGVESFTPATVEVSISEVLRRTVVVEEATAGSVSRAGTIVEYTVDLEDDTGYEIQFNNPDLELMLLDPEGSEVTLTEVDGTTFTFDAVDAGTYSVRVDGGAELKTGSYRLEVVPVEDFTIGNGSTPVVVGDLVTADDALFTDLVVRAGRRVVVDLTTSSSTLDLVFIVKDPETFEELQRFDDAGPGALESVVFTPDVTTSYRLEVQGAGDTTGPISFEAYAEDG